MLHKKESKNKDCQSFIEHARLWVSHVFLEKQCIKSAYINDPCIEEDKVALYKNVEKISMYTSHLAKSSKLPKRLSELFQEHVTLAILVVDRSVKGHSTDFLVKDWRVNASRIARCYSDINKNIKYDTMNNHMQAHLDTSLALTDAIIAQDCKRSAQASERALKHVNMMCDYINDAFRH